MFSFCAVRIFCHDLGQIAPIRRVQLLQIGRAGFQQLAVIHPRCGPPPPVQGIGGNQRKYSDGDQQ